MIFVHFFAYLSFYILHFAELPVQHVEIAFSGGGDTQDASNEV